MLWSGGVAVIFWSVTSLDAKPALNPVADGRRSVLVVEDERDLCDLISFNLEREGYRCRVASDGRTSLEKIQRDRPDLIVLDRMLPEVSGDEVAAAIKRDVDTQSIPIIMLTAKADEVDELVGFALGADDYITKPFSMKSLLARVGAVLRRLDSKEPPCDRVSNGPFQLDLSRHEVMVDSVLVDLTATELRILQTLMAANGRVLSRSRLIDAVLGTTAAVTDRTIDVHIAALRRKVRVGNPEHRAWDWIQTVRGVGYAFRAPC